MLSMIIHVYIYIYTVCIYANILNTQKERERERERERCVDRALAGLRWADFGTPPFCGNPHKPLHRL